MSTSGEEGALVEWEVEVAGGGKVFCKGQSRTSSINHILTVYKFGKEGAEGFQVYNHHFHT